MKALLEKSVEAVEFQQSAARSWSVPGDSIAADDSNEQARADREFLVPGPCRRSYQDFGFGSGTDFAARIGGIVPPVTVRHGCAKYLSGKKWARWKFKNVVVSLRICQPSFLIQLQTTARQFTGLRKTSMTFPSLVTTATAFRSLASTQIFPSRSRAMPSPPSRIG